MIGPGPALIHVVEGDVEVSDRGDSVLTTVVGSCVAACLWDPVRRAGGMNHFLLPGDEGPLSGIGRRHGVHLMELLINQLMGLGAERRRLQAKVFGGAALRRGLTEVGERNAAFVLAFLAREEIPLIGQALGGFTGRRVEFWPATGRARLRSTEVREIPVARPASRPTARPAAPVGEVEFF